MAPQDDGEQPPHRADALDSDQNGALGPAFIENRGQFDEPVRYVLRSRGMLTQLCSDSGRWAGSVSRMLAQRGFVRSFDPCGITVTRRGKKPGRDLGDVSSLTYGTC